MTRTVGESIAFAKRHRELLDHIEGLNYYVIDAHRQPKVNTTYEP